MLPDGPGRSQGAPGSTPAGHSELISAKAAVIVLVFRNKSSFCQGIVAIPLLHRISIGTVGRAPPFVTLPDTPWRTLATPCEPIPAKEARRYAS